MLFKSFALCTLLAVSAPFVAAQDAGKKKVIDNFDVTPITSTKQTSTPATPVTDTANSTSATKDKTESKATKPSTKSSRKKDAVLRTVTAPPKGEGYYQPETTSSEPAPPPPPPKIYSELRTSISDDGKLMLTSDTIVVKPDVKVVPTALNPTETTGNKELDDIIQNAGRKHQVDPRLILEIIRQESGFRMQAVSNKGARGLMQLIPSTAARMGVNRIHDPEENVNGGTKYLRLLLDMFNGNVELALAGYNAGEYAVIRNNYKVPNYRETKDYVRSITARYRSKYHQVAVAKTETVVVHKQPLATFTAEDGKVILSNNY